MLNCRKHILKKVRIIGICGNVQKIQETKCGVRILLPLPFKFYNIKNIVISQYGIIILSSLLSV